MTHGQRGNQSCGGREYTVHENEEGLSRVWIVRVSIRRGCRPVGRETTGQSNKTLIDTFTDMKGREVSLRGSCLRYKIKRRIQKYLT